MAARQHQAQAEVALLHQQLQLAQTQQRQLEAQVAREHASLQSTEGQLADLRLQMEAIELQLDGVDYLSQQVREQLGMPATGGTWEGTAGGVPRGGSRSSAVPDAQRLDIARQRLAKAVEELGILKDAAAGKSAAASVKTNGAAQVGRRLPANWPARGPVTSDFGWRWFRGLPEFHTGVDIALPYGTPVAATGDGVVLGSGWQPGYGWSVFIQHDQGYDTLFAHLSVTSVKVGDTVSPGTLVGLSGSSGNSTGPHLHYEVWKDGRLLDPRPLMDGGPSRD
jgi:murein DD-endopeptidase MepM/ murein hydrolase activator NlpD